MDFSIPQHTQDFLAEVRAFLAEEAFPLEREFVTKEFNEMLPELNRLRAEVRRRGWWLPQIEKEHGGLGLSLVEHGLLSAELGRTPIGNYIFNCQAPDSGNMEILLQHGTKEQQEKYFKPVSRGEIRSCFAMTEPEHAGSNPVWMSTTAVKDGSDYVINGHKWFTSAADGAAFAVVMAVTNPDAEPHKRASQILVPLDNPGYKFIRNISIMGHAGSGWHSHAEVRFEDCRVPQSNLLGQEGAGFTIAQDRLGPGRIHHCMRWIGICERAFDLMCMRSIHREIAPSTPLATRQFVHGWIAESRAEINAAKLMTLHAAWTIQQKGAKDARDEISMIKFYVANVLQKVVDRAIQTHGGMGVTDDTPLAFFYRAERAARIYDGPDEVHMISVAKRILKSYAAAAIAGAQG